jgi:hypothetical protein
MPPACTFTKHHIMSTVEKIQSAGINWSDLQKQAAPYTSQVSITDPVSGLTDTIYYGLYTKLSDIIKQIPEGKTHSIGIFADTLIIDVAEITVSSLLIAARNVDVTALNGNPLVMTPYTEGDMVAQVFQGKNSGGVLKLATSADSTKAVTAPANIDNLVTSSFVSSNGLPFQALPSPSDSLSDLIGATWMISSYYAGFAAVADLMDDGTAESSALAQSMLTWIVRGTEVMAASNAIPSDYLQLYNQAAALLITLNVASGATYIPVLSSTYYSGYTGQIIGVIKDYEAKVATLDTQTDIAKAISTVSATLESTAAIEVTPLKVQLDNITAAVNSLFDDIISLRNEFSLQEQRAHTAFLVLNTEITIAEINATLKAAFDMTMSGMKIGFDAAKVYKGDVFAIKDLVVDSISTLKGFIDTIKAGKSHSAGDDISVQAETLLKSQTIMMQTVLNARLLYIQAIENASTGVLPSSIAGITIDPNTDWDNYMISAETEIGSLKRSIGGGAQDAADNYLASLKILAGYGKAIGAKFVAYVAQLVQATTVLAQIKAAQDVEKRWEEVKQGAASDIEKLTALKGLVMSRLAAQKRSLYLAWTYYANAAALEAAMVGVSEWVAQAISNAPDGRHVFMPSENTEISFEFDILVNGPQPSATENTDYAILQKNGDTWMLDFTIPMGTAQLDNVLPNHGKVAIWISQASFFLEGVTPGSKGNVIAEVSTSGSYQNGVNNKANTFVTKGLSGDYAYNVPNNKVYSPWAINSAVYMTPTPYTQWNIAIADGGGDPSTATKLIVKMTVAYKSS